MIEYIYTKKNILNSPQSYMYSEFKGIKFLKTYLNNRNLNIQRFKKINPKNLNKDKNYNLSLESSKYMLNFINKKFPKEIINLTSSYLNKIQSKRLEKDYKSNSLSSFKLKKRVNSEKLLVALISNQLNKKNFNLVKFWSNRLIQKFEISKKICKIYKPNLRIGSEKNDTIRVYWLFALSLTIFFCTTNKVKYLNTLLKVSDLICSLDNKFLSKDIPLNNLMLIIYIELLSVKLMLKNLKR